MKPILRPTGQLIKKTREKNRLTTDTILTTNEQQTFASAHVVTLHEHAHVLAIQEYCDTLSPNSEPGMIGDSDQVDLLLSTKYSTLREFVRVYDDQIVIGVSATTIDDAAVNHALRLLLKCDTLDVGTFVRFGDPVKLY